MSDQATRASRQIDPNLSTYLDLVRLVAALVVFSTHARNFLLPAVNLGPLLYGRDAVAVFFVLSGFVISYVAGSKEPDWRSYVTARAARILPVCVLAILVTAAVDATGIAYNPDYYTQASQQFGFYGPGSIAAALSYLTFTNQLWFQHVVFGTDEPYWSLGFEVQYYVMFGLVIFLKPGVARIAGLALWAAIAGPKILMYLPMWLMGVACFRIVAAGRIRRRIAALVLIDASLAIFYLAHQCFGSGATAMFKTFDLPSEEVNFIYFNAIGLAALAHLVGMAALLRTLPPIPAPAGRAIRWLAGASFTIYLVHQPILVFFASFIQPAAGLLLPVTGMVAALAICFALAELAERRKKTFAALFSGLARLPERLPRNRARRPRVVA